MLKTLRGSTMFSQETGQITERLVLLAHPTSMGGATRKIIAKIPAGLRLVKQWSNQRLRAGAWIPIKAQDPWNRGRSQPLAGKVSLRLWDRSS